MTRRPSEFIIILIIVQPAILPIGRSATVSAISSVHIIKCNLRKVGDDQPKNIPHTRKGNAPKT